MESGYEINYFSIRPFHRGEFPNFAGKRGEFPNFAGKLYMGNFPILWNGSRNIPYCKTTCQSQYQSNLFIAVSYCLRFLIFLRNSWCVC